MNRYQQRIVQINWICLKRSILQSPRSCKAIGCQARHAVNASYRKISWKRKVSIFPPQLDLQTSHLFSETYLVHAFTSEAKMYNTQSNAKHLLFQFETENTTPEFDITNKPGIMMPCMTSLPNKGAQTQLWIGNVYKLESIKKKSERSEWFRAQNKFNIMMAWTTPCFTAFLRCPYRIEQYLQRSNTWLLMQPPSSYNFFPLLMHINEIIPHRSTTSQTNMGMITTQFSRSHGQPLQRPQEMQQMLKIFVCRSLVFHKHDAMSDKHANSVTTLHHVTNTQHCTMSDKHIRHNLILPHRTCIRGAKISSNRARSSPTAGHLLSGPRPTFRAFAILRSSMTEMLAKASWSHSRPLVTALLRSSCNRTSTPSDDEDDAVACSIRTDIPFSKWNSDPKIARYNDSRDTFLSTAHAFQWKHHIYFFYCYTYIVKMQFSRSHGQPRIWVFTICSCCMVFCFPIRDSCLVHFLSSEPRNVWFTSMEQRGQQGLHVKQ